MWWTLNTLLTRKICARKLSVTYFLTTHWMICKQRNNLLRCLVRMLNLLGSIRALSGCHLYLRVRTISKAYISTRWTCCIGSYIPKEIKFSIISSKKYSHQSKLRNLARSIQLSCLKNQIFLWMPRRLPFKNASTEMRTHFTIMNSIGFTKSRETQTFTLSKLSLIKRTLRGWRQRQMIKITYQSSKSWIWRRL